MPVRAPVVQNGLGKPANAQPVIAVGLGGDAAGAPRTVVVTPVVSATPDYSDGDSIGGVMLVAAVVALDGAAGVLSYVNVVSKVAIGANIDLIVFNANPTGSTFTDNLAAVVAAADLPKVIGRVALPSAGWLALSGTQVLQAVATAVPLTGLAVDDIWVAAIARGAINLGAVDDLTFRFSAT